MTTEAEKEKWCTCGDLLETEHEKGIGLCEFCQWLKMERT